MEDTLVEMENTLVEEETEELEEVMARQVGWVPVDMGAGDRHWRTSPSWTSFSGDTHSKILTDWSTHSPGAGGAGDSNYRGEGAGGGGILVNGQQPKDVGDGAGRGYGGGGGGYDDHGKAGVVILNFK